MPVVITTTGDAPTVGADFDVWGGELNSNISSVKTDLDALAVAVNINTPIAAAALPKAGGTMTGDITLADVAPSSPFSAGFRGAPVVSIDVDRVIQASDAGKCIRLFGTNSRNWTIPLNALPVGSVVVLRNFTTANTITVTRAGGVVLRVDGSSVDANVTIAPFGKAVLFEEDANIWTISGVGVS